jgi:cytochrome c peroxidase
MTARLLTLLLALAVFTLAVSGFRGAPFLLGQPIETGPYKLDYPANFGDRISIPANNPLTKEGVALGRLLFYEKRLSGDNSMSCGSCHQQQRAFADGQAFSRGIHGHEGRRSAMALVNLAWVRTFFWDGRAASLEEQARVPIEDSLEMHQPLAQGVAKLQRSSSYPPLFKLVFGSEQISGENVLKALAQFERTLISSNSRYDQYLRGEYQPTAEEKAGLNLFMTHPIPEENLRGANCGDCHAGPKTFMEFYHNNGLDAKPKDLGREGFSQRYQDRGRFRVPSLRNIALTAPYMHDGRFQTLEQVLNQYNEHVQPHATLSPLVMEATNQRGGKTLLLTEAEKKAVVAFLHMLTDSTFISNPQFADPFARPKAGKRRH